MDYDELPDGNVYVAYDDEDYVAIESKAHLSDVLDTVRALAAQREIGQLVSLVVSVDQGLCVWMDVPGGLGWALSYDDAPVHAISVGRRTGANDEMVDIKFGWDWEEQTPKAFLDESVARRATMEFLRTLRRPTGIDWELQGEPLASGGTGGRTSG